MPFRSRRVLSVLALFHIRETTVRGSHRKLVADDGRTYIIPASHGDTTAIPNVYVRAACRAFGLDEYEVFNHLRGTPLDPAPAS